jgi:hypothetical protein
MGRRRRRTNPRKIEVDLEAADRGPTHLPAVVVAGHHPHIHRIPTHPIPHTVAGLLGRRVAANPQDRRVVVDRRRNAVNRTESDRLALTVDLRTLVEEAGKIERQKSDRSMILLVQKARVLKIGRRRTRRMDPVKGLMIKGIGPKMLRLADLSNERNAKVHHSVHDLQIATVRSVILLAKKARVLKIGRRRTKKMDPVKSLVIKGIVPKVLPVADLSNERNAKPHHSVHGLQIATVRSVILLAQKARVLKIGRRRTRRMDPVKGLMSKGIVPKILPAADLSNERNAKPHHSVHGLQIATDVLAREVFQEKRALARNVTVGAILGRHPDLAVRVPFRGPTLEIGVIKLVSSNCITY